MAATSKVYFLLSSAFNPVIHIQMKAEIRSGSGGKGKQSKFSKNRSLTFQFLLAQNYTNGSFLSNFTISLTKNLNIVSLSAEIIIHGKRPESSCHFCFFSLFLSLSLQDRETLIAIFKR